MVQRNWKWALPLAAAMMILPLSACASNPQDANGGANGTEAAAPNNTENSSSEQTPSTTADSAVKVIWWHSMGGELGKVADALVSKFNSTHSDIQVEAVYQGAYDESLNKLKASMDSKSGPSLIQVYEIGSRFMIDSGAVTPVQQFIDAEGYDVSSLEPNIRSYYTFGGKQYSMPFNTSNPILYYNKDLFSKAGLDPNKPPQTYAEVAEYAKKLTGDGVTGASFAIYGWFMEQLMANQGKDIVNNGNGRDSEATESIINDQAAVDTLNWWKGMVDDKTALNLGRKTDDTKKAFLAGQIAMTLDSTASLRGIADGAAGKFEVGTGFLPKPDASVEGGVVIGGASLWIMNNKSEEEQKAAWEFEKFLADPATQAEWHINTGYFPITVKAYDEQIVKDNLAKYPQFQTAIDQLHASKPSTATQGGVMGVFPEARQIVEGAIEETFTGKKDAKSALDDAAKQITDKLDIYNKTVQK